MPLNSNTFRRTARLLLALIASAQVVVAVGGPWLDSWFERRSQGAIAHVESSTADTCVALHDHDMCALCRDLGRSKLPATGTLAIAVSRAAAPLHPGGTGRDPVARIEIPVGSRAPPSA